MGFRNLVLQQETNIYFKKYLRASSCFINFNSYFHVILIVKFKGESCFLIYQLQSFPLKVTKKSCVRESIEYTPEFGSL